MTTALSFQNLTLGYDRHPVVHHLRTEIAEASLTAIVGPNGAGKSTLLKGVTGTLAPLLARELVAHVFDYWLDTLIALKGPDILRSKGTALIEDIDDPFVFHGVQHLFDPPVRLEDWTGDDRRTRIVAIARDKTRPELQRSLDILRAGLPDRRAKAP
ncbi:MAG: hypothetical protein CML68_19055 [Rhodobacteraceae bacterium]|nr:hypothetical protein [Paracoccaceae bacterium]